MQVSAGFCEIIYSTPLYENKMGLGAFFAAKYFPSNLIAFSKVHDSEKSFI